VSSEAVRKRVFNAPSVNIHDGDEGAPGLAGHGAGEEPDGPSADYEGGGARGRGGAVYGVDGDGEGLEKGGSVKGDVVWESV